MSTTELLITFLVSIIATILAPFAVFGIIWVYFFIGLFGWITNLIPDSLRHHY